MVRPELSRYVCPYRREPARIVIRFNKGASLHLRSRFPVAPGFAKEQNVLNVILDDAIGQVGLSKKTTGTGGFQLDVGDLAPTNGGKAVVAGPHLQVRG